ncbi:MAG: AAA family ATPase [Chloroflexota bacterium]|nr:AAA family ATPase [Chloroflexota bacterium]
MITRDDVPTLRASDPRTPLVEGGPAELDGRLAELTPVSAIRSERVRWLWTGRVPLRGMAVVAGEKGLGKSTLTNAYLPAKLTRGLLDGELADEPADVLLATGEDDYGSVVKPRLIAHGADLDRVHRLRIRDGQAVDLLTLPDDVPLIERNIAELRSKRRRVGAVVIDPIGAFLAGATDSHKDAHVRRALAPLAAMAERLDLAAIVVAHLTKDDSSRLINRVSGSGAFVNAARSVLGFCRSPDDPDGEQGRERVLVHVASNWGRLAPSLAMRIEARDVGVDDGSIADVGYLVVTGEITLSAEDLQRESQDGGSKAELARHWLLDRLGHGGWSDSGAVKTEGRAASHAPRTLQRVVGELEAEGAAEVKSEGFPRRTYWRIHSRAKTIGAIEDDHGGATGETAFAEPNPKDEAAQSRQGTGSGATGTANNRAADIRRRIRAIAALPETEQEPAWQELERMCEATA